jgi:hypothetical protein
MSLSGLGDWYQYTGVEDDDAVRGRPFFVDLGHPVMGLAE